MNEAHVLLALAREETIPGLKLPNIDDVVAIEIHDEIRPKVLKANARKILGI